MTQEKIKMKSFFRSLVLCTVLLFIHDSSQQGTGQGSGQGSQPSSGQGSQQSSGQGSQQSSGQGSQQGTGQGSQQSSGQGSQKGTGQGSQQDASQGSQPVPLISYECKANHSIKITMKNLTAYGSYAAGPAFEKQDKLKYSNGTTANCLVGVSKSNSQNTVEVTNCTEDIYFYVMKDTQVGSSKVFGGANFHVYHISCKLPTLGIGRIVGPANMSAVLNHTNYETAKPDFKDFQASMNFDKDQPSIGEKVLVTINEIDSTRAATDMHYVLPKSCNATGGSQELKLIADGTALDDSILKKFDVSKKGSATANMFAFSFISSETVTLTCEVTLCDNMKCGKGYGNTVQKRSFSENNSDNTFKVSADYKIAELKSGQQKVGTNAMSLFLVLTSLAVCLKILHV